MKVKTLGYYNLNDGGGSYYVITDNSQEPYVEKLNNNLYAYIITDKINVKQFGAYGNGINDDYQPIINAINYAKENNTVYIPDGNYLISNTINLENNITLEGLNSVPTLIYTGDNIFINLYGGKKINILRNPNKVKKPLLSSLSLTTNATNTFKNGTICLNFTNDDNLDYGDCFLEKLMISRFGTGVLMGNTHFYIVSFINVQIVRNNIGISNISGGKDSGEKISFTRCIIDVNLVAINLPNPGYDLEILDSSLDYNTCLFQGNGTNSIVYDSRKIVIDNCHIETNNEDKNFNYAHGIIYKTMPGTVVYFNNSKIITKINEPQFNTVSDNEYGQTKIYFNNCSINWWDKDYSDITLSPNIYFIPYKKEYGNNFVGYGTNNVMQIGSGFGIGISCQSTINNVPGLQYPIVVGNCSLDNNNIKDKNNNNTGLKILNSTNVSSYNIYNNTEYNTNFKTLQIIPTDQTKECVFTITEQQSFINKNNSFFTTSFKNIKEIQLRVCYLDEQNNILNYSDWSYLLKNNTIANTVINLDRYINIGLSYLYTKGKKARLEIEYRSIANYIPEINSMNVNVI